MSFIFIGRGIRTTSKLLSYKRIPKYKSNSTRTAQAQTGRSASVYFGLQQKGLILLCTNKGKTNRDQEGQRTVRSSRKRREQTNPPAMVMSSDEANLALYISSSDSVTAKSSSDSSIDRPVLAI